MELDLGGSDTSKEKIPNVTSITHPNYNECSSRWVLYENIWKGGDSFKNAYLEKYSNRETAADYKMRKRITYIPGHAKTAVLEVKNSIYERFIDISRTGGSEKYNAWVRGEKGGVDGNNLTLNQFIGTVVLKNLLVKARVGVYVDAPQLAGITKRDEASFMPYAYMYKAEDIRTWTRGGSGGNEIVAVLLRDYEYKKNTLGLVSSIETKYRLLTLVDDSGINKVKVQFFDKKGKELASESIILDIPKIPFEFVEIDHSVLEAVAEHQIALLNLASGDLHYCLKANYPFYTEQVDARTHLDGLTGSNDFSDKKEGTAENAEGTSSRNVNIGPTNGRSYTIGTERPGFIHPSAEPLNASMKKQEEIRTEIRQLVMLSVSSLSKDAPVEGRDDQGLESGLAYIGMTLELLERKIAEFFAMYENTKDKPATIQYPTDYRIKSEEARQKEADKLLDILPKLPSLTFQKETAKRVAELVLGHWVSNDKLDKINKEIDSASIVNVDPENILADVEAGILSESTASKARLYPDDEITKAREDHAARLRRILIAQTSNNIIPSPAARGLQDIETNDSAIDEKEVSQNADLQDDRVKATRGEGKK